MGIDRFTHIDKSRAYFRWSVGHCHKIHQQRVTCNRICKRHSSYCFQKCAFRFHLEDYALGPFVKSSKKYYAEIREEICNFVMLVYATDLRMQDFCQPAHGTILDLNCLREASGSKSQVCVGHVVACNDFCFYAQTA
jgi:hypothetical protein